MEHHKVKSEIIELINSRGEITSNEAATKIGYSDKVMRTYLSQYVKKGVLVSRKKADAWYNIKLYSLGPKVHDKYNRNEG